MTDTEMLDWIEKDPETRLEDVRGHIINEGTTVREAIGELSAAR